MIRTPGSPDVHVAVVQYAPTSEAVEVFAGLSEGALENRIRNGYELDPMIRAVRDRVDFSERQVRFRIPADGLPDTYHVFVPLVEGEFDPDREVCHGNEVGPLLGCLFNRYNGEAPAWSAVRFDVTYEDGSAGSDVDARFGGEFVTR